MTFTRTLRGLALAALAMLPMGPVRAAPPEANAGLPRATLRIAGHAVVAEVAATAQARETGLMFRRDLPADHGMLFVFGTPQRVCMWMKNTLVPLSVAFVDGDGRVVNLADMRPLSEDVHCSAGDVRYALEMPLHWFSQRAVRPGTPVGGLPAAR